MIYSIDPPNKESAEERAIRKWRNNSIIRKIKLDSVIDPLPKIQNVPSKIRQEIMAIFSERNTNIIKQYIISIEARRRKLLKEKLRRIEEQASND